MHQVVRVGEVVLDLRDQRNSITALKNQIIDIDGDTGMNQESRQRLNQVLQGTLHEPREHPTPYK